MGAEISELVEENRNRSGGRACNEVPGATGDSVFDRGSDCVLVQAAACMVKETASYPPGNFHGGAAHRGSRRACVSRSVGGSKSAYSDPTVVRVFQLPGTGGGASGTVL